ncbi:hypothetical protein HJD18_12515 [Thermoleophilia bacterium SCSIO 60948]|nr:hypothetical protein HJD18_12515 [Thermoleophilia bacterium SCSIO 60948]
MTDALPKTALHDEKRRLEIAVVGGDDSPAARAVKAMYEGRDYESLGLSPSDEQEAIKLLAEMGKFHLFDEMVAGAERLAESIHSVATRGLQEVVQNAEDQQASTVRFGFRKGRSGSGELLVAHDGRPVELRDVLKMSLPLISGSRHDAEKIGQFGVGLKTLKQLGRELQVHCRPLPSFSIEDGRIKPASPARPIAGFWDADARETLFVLTLKEKEFDLGFFEDWIAKWDASSLLFLDHVSSVSLTELGRRKKLIRSCRLRRGPDRPSSLTVARALDIREATVTEPGSNRRWTRYVARFRRPQALADAGDRLGETLDVRLAVPGRALPSRVYVGLPLEEPSSLPFSVGSKHFKLSTDRTDLLAHKRNSWLVDAIGELAVAVAVERLSSRPKIAWRAIALSTEECGGSEWLRSQFDRMIERQWRELAKRGSLRLAGGEVPLDDLVYEVDELESVLQVADVERLWLEAYHDDARTVPKSARDGGRWRDVLSDPACRAEPLDFTEARGVFDWSDEEIGSRGGGWLVDFVAACLTLRAGEQLTQLRCVPLADGRGRLSPEDVIEKGALLVHTVSDSGLAASLGLAQQIAPQLRSTGRAAQEVRQWLSEVGALHQRASDEATIRALASASGARPHDLRSRPDVLKRLKNSFDQLSQEERTSLGHGVGRNIAIEGYVNMNSRKQPVSVKPVDAYLPSAIDSSPFPRAAGKTKDLRWVDPSYRELLAGPRGRGALAFLRELGAATAPRLVPAAQPTKNPHAPKLTEQDGLCAQHQEELQAFPRATGLQHDWESPDAYAIAVNIASERKLAQRQARARAFVLAINERWGQYADRTEATAVWHYGSFHEQGTVTATWLARLASYPWFTTRERGLNAACPRDLAVLTEAAFGVEGENRARYSGELEPEHADLSFVAALGIRGRPRASDVLAQLGGLKDANRAGRLVEQQEADRYLAALSDFVTGGRYESESDMSDEQIRRALADPGREGGLILVADSWLSPTNVRRGPQLHTSLPCTSAAPGLLEAIGVPKPSAAECVGVLQALAQEESVDRTAEFRVFERLLDLASESRRGLGALARTPLRLHSGWHQTRRRDDVFATADSALAKQLGEKWPVWAPPMPLARLDPLLPKLGIVLLGPENVEADIPQRLLSAELDRRAEFLDALSRFRHYLQIHHVDLYGAVTAETWRSLADAALIISPDWALRVRAPHRRVERVSVDAYLFDDPNVLCLADDDQLGRREGAAQAIAARVGGPDASEAELSTLALVWAEAFRDDSGPEFDLDPSEAPQDAPDFLGFDNFERRTRRRGSARRKSVPRHQAPIKEKPRRLHTIDELDLSEIGGLLLEGNRRGATIRLSSRSKLVLPKKQRRGSSPSRPARAGNREYTDEDRENLALDLISTVLADRRGVELEDIRHHKNAGADAVDRSKDVWVEIKAHGKDMPEAVRFEPSEFELAEKKKGRYLLAIVWGLEVPRRPDYVLVSDPLRRLDRKISGRVHLSGIGDLRRRAGV